MADFKLGESEIEVSFPIIYRVTQSLEKTEIYAVTEKMLEQYNVPLHKFLAFLNKDLAFEDKVYQACLELWSSNKHISTDICITETKALIDSITSIEADIEILNKKR